MLGLPVNRTIRALIQALIPTANALLTSSTFTIMPRQGMLPGATGHPIVWFRRSRWLLLFGLLIVFVASFVPRTVHAEEPSFTISRSFGADAENTQSVAVGDLNGDGYLDIVVGNHGQNAVYLNDGAGNFDAIRHFGTDQDNTQSVAVGDLNGDGYLDIVVGGNNGQSAVYLNDGVGNFGVTRHFGTGADMTISIAVGDLNGDGFLDIVAANNGQNLVYLNDGRGNFGVSLNFGTGQDNTQSVVVGDLNGDGSLDIVVGNSHTQNVVYLNDGRGNFGAARNFGTGADDARSVAVGDMNGDGFLDIVVGNNGQNAVYLNDGRGNFGVSLNFGTSNSYPRVAVGDMNGDGYLDIVVGNSHTQNVVYLNDGAGNFATTRDFGTGDDDTYSMAVGDMNGDGHLDIIVGNYNAQGVVYLNDGAGNFDATRDFGTGQDATESVAVGDMNGDGSLDIVTANIGQNLVYLNDGAGNFDVTRHFGTDQDNTQSVAVGDLNGDGFLDIVVGNHGQNAVYLNDGRGNFGVTRHFGTDQNNTQSVAVGDLNGDGSLDIVTANIGQNVVYLNDGAGNFGVTRNFGTGDSYTCMAVGDMNGDGSLDIVVGNHGQDAVYLNDGAGNFGAARNFGTGAGDTGSVAVGDLNGDGFLDIVVGNHGQDAVYLNDGRGNFGAKLHFGTSQDDTLSIAVGDINGDGHLDIVVGHSHTQAAVYLNDGAGNFGAKRNLGTSVYATQSVAVGDLNGDGHLDIVASRLDIVNANVVPNVVYLNKIQGAPGLTKQTPWLDVKRPGLTGNANFFSAPAMLSSPTIPITYTLFGGEGDRVGRVAAFYSLDGGGVWLPAVAVSTTVATHLATAPTGVKHVYTWDTFASGFFGQSDNVVLRLVAYSQPLTTTQPITGSYRYTNSAAGPMQWATASATTFPFRARGTQMRVVDEHNQPLAGALVYRLPAGQFSDATPLADAADRPFRTDGQGYLSGRGALQLGDSLVALLPVTPTHPLTFTQQFSYFLTSAAPNSNGLALTELRHAGVVTLTVPTAPTTNTHPLLLFNLTVSLEWDASADDLFQAELENGFKRASELLFKVTNGQAALGRVDVLPAKSFWNRADLILYASNSLRPSAAIGGVVKAAMGERVLVNPPGQTVTKTIAAAYVPGQIRMGTSWDPFGEEAGDLSEQWWRALAHELSHHLFFLPDDYVGFKTAGSAHQWFLGRVDCRGSFMTTTFDPSYTRFLNKDFWTGDCENTVAAFSTGRSDWETITHFYPMLNPPVTPLANGVNLQLAELPDGPNLLPLDVTHLVFWSLPKRRPTLPARYFQLRSAGALVRLPTARVYLFQTQGNGDPTDDVLLAFGSPTGGGDRIKVRGGQSGDRLCLLDFGASDGKTYTGCIRNLSAASVSIPVRPLEPSAGAARWLPAIDVRALTTRTLLVTVTQPLPPNTQLKMQVFPAHYPSAPGVAPVAGLTLTHGIYVGQVSLLYPASDVSVRVWVDDGTGLEAVSQFSLQLPWKPNDQIVTGPNTVPLGGPNTVPLGGPNTVPLGGPNTVPLGGPNTVPLGGTDYPIVGGSPHFSFAAPAFSADAQVIIYNLAGVFEPNGIQNLQILPSPPEVGDESWLAPVGQAYFVQPDPTVKAKRAIAITYLQRDVPEGYEYTLTIYYLPQGGKSWQRLDTKQFVENLLVADLQAGAGTYAVMSTVVLPALSSGLNLFTYPLPDTRPITTALASLAGHYSELYEVSSNGKLLSTPKQLVFGHTYAIQIESNASVYLYLAPPRRLPNGQIPGQE